MVNKLIATLHRNQKQTPMNTIQIENVTYDIVTDGMDIILQSPKQDMFLENGIIGLNREIYNSLGNVRDERMDEMQEMFLERYVLDNIGEFEITVND